MTSSNNKQYGLIIPKKFNINEVKRATVFNNDSDSDDSKEAGTSDWIKKSFQKQAAAQSGGVRRQTEIDMKRALDQDPTVYKYDEIYDELEKKKTDEDKKKCASKKPRYIQKLLKTAENRKLENERRIERQVQKERDAEGEQFKDKETFVTSAYKKKLEEFHKLDEEERRRDMLEEMCDVSKQRDLGGFYRHLYKTTVDKQDSCKEKDERENSEPDNKVKNDKVVMKDLRKKESRQYRKRKSSESSSLEEGEHNSDSDTSIASSSDSSSSASEASVKSNSTKSIKLEKENDKHGKKQIVKKERSSKEKDVRPSETSGDSEKKNNTDISKGVNVDSVVDINTHIKVEDNTTTSEECKVEMKETKPKVNIWEKRTVGAVLDAALERYFKRKAERLANRGI